jgi:purine-binding chemotaxis protein CheW
MSDAAAPAGEERSRILAERTQALAAARDETERETWPVIAFLVAGSRHAVPASQVRQILEAGRLSPLAGAPTWLLGAIQARARVVPVLNLRVLLGTSGGGIADATRVLLLEDDGDLFAVAVDQVEGRLELPRQELTEIPDGGLVQWLGPDRLSILDVSRLGVGQPSGGGGQP